MNFGSLRDTEDLTDNKINDESDQVNLAVVR
jgi:hypothetical protein